MARPKQRRPARLPSEQDEKIEIIRQQVRDVTVDGQVRLWMLAGQRFVWVNPAQALELCLRGQASIEDPPGRKLPRSLPASFRSRSRYKSEPDEGL